MSVCEVTSPTTYENRAPKTGGLLDLRMGTIARDHRCLTCQGSMVCNACHINTTISMCSRMSAAGSGVAAVI